MTTPYDALGGTDAVRALVDRFYELMDEWPETYGLRQMHPQDLRGARQSLYEYLSGWLGGPPLYTEKKVIRACACATCPTRLATLNATNG